MLLILILYLQFIQIVFEYTPDVQYNFVEVHLDNKLLGNFSGYPLGGDNKALYEYNFGVSHVIKIQIYPFNETYEDTKYIIFGSSFYIEYNLTRGFFIDQMFHDDRAHF